MTMVPTMNAARSVMPSCMSGVIDGARDDIARHSAGGSGEGILMRWLMLVCALLPWLEASRLLDHTTNEPRLPDRLVVCPGRLCRLGDSAALLGAAAPCQSGRGAGASRNLDAAFRCGDGGAGAAVGRAGRAAAAAAHH